jgi:hypothetical protein
VRLVERATIVLHVADGLQNQQIGELMGISRFKAGRWRDRYAERGLWRGSRRMPRVLAASVGSMTINAPRWCIRRFTSSQDLPQGVTPVELHL